MKIPITQKMLMDWAGTRVYHYGKNIFEENRVSYVRYEHPVVEGVLDHGPRGLQCRFELLPDGSVDNQCPCRDNRDRGIICAHVIAVSMELIRRHTDPDRDRKALEELRRTERLAAEQGSYLDRVSAGTPGALPAELRLTLAEDWREAVATGSAPVRCDLVRDQSATPVDEAKSDRPFALSAQDENLLFVLEDICGGPARAQIELPIQDFLNILEIHRGKPLFIEGADEPATANAVAMHSVLNMDLDRENGELILMIHTELPFMSPHTFPTYIVSNKGGWVYDAGHFWPLANILPPPLHGIYSQPVYVERKSVPHFIKNELPLIAQHIQVISDLTEDLFTIDPAVPRFKLIIRGSPASLAATLYAVYDGLELVAAKPETTGHFALPDPDDLMRYLVRNLPGENRALALLAQTGLLGARGDLLDSIVGCDQVLNFLGGGIPPLRRMGWKIELEGRIAPFMEELDFALPVVNVHQPEGSKWFEVGFQYEGGQGESLSEADIQRALLKNESFIQRNGKTILLDAGAIQTARDVFRDCSSGEGSQPGTFRMGNIYAAYVQSSLDSLDGVDVEAAPAWLQASRIHNRRDTVSPVPIEPQTEAILRPYQKDGVYWLHFLARNGFCGILADEMGLGKTLQALLWIQHHQQANREHPKPVLIVCPTSLVENWAEESARFTPSLKVLLMSGAERHKYWDDAKASDLVVTSYALIRRDIDQYREIEFSIILLDEAQHIKNHSTQNAVAAKQLRGDHRLVLTGTPIENSVADLWSIMDFLMPGYLGSNRSFRDNYELPISREGPEAEQAQIKLRRKLHPFLLRRMKKDVAKDLPPKIQRLISCSLTKDQQVVYNQMLLTSRRKINDLVEQKGFNHARMEILKVLLRLRQICCHLDLLKLDHIASTHPSAKMDLFFELIDEAIDGGHRVLVFSQFTSMLAILRRELDERNRTYCYLDGATKNRLAMVKEFNTNHAIPVFLISLKAGGTGLNLTGADMVIHYDPWWNPAVEDQATDRAYRIGQKRTVYNVKMITRGTVDEKVLAMQERKKHIINATLSQDDQVMQKLTWEDVQDLLSV